MQITIGHLYPDLLNMYGDKGNITVLSNRCKWRGIETSTKCFNLDDEIDFNSLDIVVLGGGTDREQKRVCARLLEMKGRFTEYIENNGVVLAVCGGYQMLGKYYRLKEEEVEGIGAIDIYTDYNVKRLISNVIIKSDICDTEIVGFENHAGRTYIGSCAPLGRVVHGGGNNETDKTEGIIYKNVLGTNLHGPLLPKNPEVCDYLIKNALIKKYGACELEKLDDATEIKANQYITQKYIYSKQPQH